MTTAADDPNTPPLRDPPLWLLWVELRLWVREIFPYMSDADARDVGLYVRRFSTSFRIGEKDENLMTWNGWDVNWMTGRARRTQDPPAIDYPLKVQWDAVQRAVTAVRKQQDREQIAPAPVGPPKSPEPSAPIASAPTSSPAVFATPRAGAARGGTPPHPDRDNFDREVVRRLTLDGGNFSLTQFRNEMKQWASDNITPPPDTRTVERWVERLVLPGLLHD